jgi:hypothetical protein
VAGSKKIISLSIKLFIGIASFWIIYSRLIQTPQLKEQCMYWFSQPHMYFMLLLALLLMPVNWGIESYKWKSITHSVEAVSYTTALKSVFSGVCVGNIAPGRAMEFLAKIVFFKPENRPTITVLHFINGMFQMLITCIVGIISITYKLNQVNQSATIVYLVITGGLVMIAFFCWAILNVAFIQNKLTFIKWFRKMGDAQRIQFSKPLIVKLISFSIIRYVVFTTQFYIIYRVLSPGSPAIHVFTSIAGYFMFTSLIPMISFIEPAIRGAIAIFVFNGAGDNPVNVVLASTFVWMINVVVPSIIGYVIIFREKIEFRQARVD